MSPSPGTSDDNQIHVIAHSEIYTRTDSDAANKAQQLNPRLTGSGTSLQLRLPAIEGAKVDLIITVPSASTQTITANHGDIHLTGITGPVMLTANHGDRGGQRGERPGDGAYPEQQVQLLGAHHRRGRSILKAAATTSPSPTSTAPF